MKTSAELDKELEDIIKVLSVWDYRLENYHILDDFSSNSFQELLTKSEKTIEKYNISENNFTDLSKYDSLNDKDILITLTAGCLGAITPKISSDFFDKIHETLNKSNSILGKIFNHRGEWIDSVMREDGRRVIKGKFHRFRPDGNHDLLNLQGLITSVRQFGLLKGTIKYIIHMILDSCSQTGIPLPGTSNFLYYIRTKMGMKLYSLKDQSYWSALRMGNFLQCGVTSSILMVYEKIEKIPQDSLRIPQLGLWSHGLSLLGATYIATQTNNPIMLSKISYPTALMFLKNFYSFHSALNKITKESELFDEEIDKLINESPNYVISRNHF